MYFKQTQYYTYIQHSFVQCEIDKKLSGEIMRQKAWHLVYYQAKSDDLYRDTKVAYKNVS